MLKVELDINKRNYNGNTLLYRILNRPSWNCVDNFKSLVEPFEDVNVGGLNGFRRYKPGEDWHFKWRRSDTCIKEHSMYHLLVTILFPNLENTSDKFNLIDHIQVLVLGSIISVS